MHMYNTCNFKSCELEKMMDMKQRFLLNVHQLSRNLVFFNNDYVKEQFPRVAAVTGLRELFPLKQMDIIKSKGMLHVRRLLLVICLNHQILINAVQSCSII